MMNKIFITLSLLMLVTYKSDAQNKLISYPKVGDTIQDHTFTDLANYPNKKVSINDLRGNWLIIDCWTSVCSGCIASFPKMNKLNDQFKGQVQLLMVGIHSGKSKVSSDPTSEEATKSMFKFQQKKYRLKFPNAFVPGTFVDKYDISAVPFILVVNPKGVIVAKTLSIDSASLSKLLMGEKVNLPRAFNKHEEYVDENFQYTENLPLLTSGAMANGSIPDTSFAYRSLISIWKGGNGWNGGTPIFETYGFKEVRSRPLENLDKIRGEAFGCDLVELLRVAYTGATHIPLTTFPKNKVAGNTYLPVILELNDKSMFGERDKFQQNMWNYSIQLPSSVSSVELKMKYMRDDLERAFNFSSEIELRKLPALILVLTDSLKLAKFKTKSAKRTYAATNNGVGIHTKKLTNYSIPLLASQLRSGLPKQTVSYGQSELIDVYDETGIKYNVDVEIKADFEHLDSIRRALGKYGLDLVKGEKEMECIVVKDANTTAFVK